MEFELPVDKRNFRFICWMTFTDLIDMKYIYWKSMMKIKRICFSIYTNLFHWDIAHYQSIIDMSKVVYYRFAIDMQFQFR